MSKAIAIDKAVAAFIQGSKLTFCTSGLPGETIDKAIRRGLTAAAPELPTVQEAYALAAFIRASTHWGMAVALVSSGELSKSQAAPVLQRLEDFIRGVVTDPTEAETVITMSEIREIKKRSNYPESRT